MILHAPFIIGSRLLPALRVEGLTISLTYSDRPGDEQRTRYWYALDFDDGTTYEADDFQSGNIGDPGLQYGFENLLGFMDHAAEHYGYFKDDDEEKYEAVFSYEIDAKLYEVGGDEIGMLRCEIEETPGLIEE